MKPWFPLLGVLAAAIFGGLVVIAVDFGQRVAGRDR